MPWHISDKAAGCSGYAVVKDDTGEVVTCHKTKGDAEAHLKALYASEADKMDMSGGPNSPTARNAQQGTASGMPSATGRKKRVPVQKASKTYSPNDGMKSAAKRALAWHQDGQRGGTIIGLTRANQIVNGTDLSESTVKRMYSFFSRHEVDKKATGFSAGEEGYPSPGRVAWDLWGGDAGFSWSRGIAEGLRKEYDMESDQTDMHDWEGLNERQSDMADAYCEVVMEYGQFDQTSGPDGAHYGDGSKNPFKSDGLKCSSCIFFEDGACHLVSGQIDPEGVCKLWIIPESGGADSMEQDQIDIQSEDNIDEIQKKDYSTQERNRMAHAGQAMADGSYPIATEQDLRNAIQSYGRASDPEAVKRHIISRARALGRVDLIPESWNVKKSDSLWGGNFIPQ